jgi:hypothetical protein
MKLLGSKPLKAVGFALTCQQVKAIKAESRKTGLSMSDIVRRAIDAYLKE